LATAADVSGEHTSSNVTARREDHGRNPPVNNSIQAICSVEAHQDLDSFLNLPDSAQSDREWSN